MSNKSGSIKNQSSPTTDNQQQQQHNGDDSPPSDISGTIPQTLNDNSNPQQGTGGIRPTVATSPISNELTGVPAPQQQRITLLIPPTVKDARKLFVGGLPSDVTCDEFRAFFAVYGTVLDSVVMYDHVTSNSRGFGFVTFEDEAVSNHLLELGRLEMRGKLVEVKPALPKGKALSSSSTSVSNHSVAAQRKPHGGPPRRLDSGHAHNANNAAASMAQVNFDNLSLMAMAPTSPPTAAKQSRDNDASTTTITPVATIPAPYAPPMQNSLAYETYPVPPTLGYDASGTSSNIPAATPTGSHIGVPLVTSAAAVAAPVVPLVGTYYAPPSPGPTVPFQAYGSYYSGSPSENPYYHTQYHQPHFGNGSDMYGCYGPVYYTDSSYQATMAYSSPSSNQGASPPFPRKTE